MSKINLSRRQFINATSASAGLYGMTGWPNLVLGNYLIPSVRFAAASGLDES
jgi:hypothetical protein